MPQVASHAGIAAVEGEEGRWTVTNLDPRESALNRVSPEQLQAAMGSGAGKADDEARQQDGAAAATARVIPFDVPEGLDNP